MTGSLRDHDNLIAALATYDAWDATDGAVNLRVRIEALNEAARRCGYIGHADLIDWSRERSALYQRTNFG